MSNIPTSNRSITTEIHSKSVDSNEKESNIVTSSTDLLYERLEQYKQGTIHSEAEISSRSYEIFSKIHHCSKSQKTQISDLFQEYTDLIQDSGNTTLIPIMELANILYFDNGITDNLVTDLNGWINEYDPMPEHQDDNEYNEDVKDMTYIWETARRHLLRGNLCESMATLETILPELNLVEAEAVKHAISLIADFMQLPEVKSTAYAEEWNTWHEHCQDRLQRFMCTVDGQAAEIDDEIQLLYSVLAGEQVSIFAAGDYFERVIGLIQFVRPNTTIEALGPLAQQAVSSSDTLDAAEYLLMGLLDDTLEVSKDVWLQAHLGHALLTIGAKSSSVSSTDAEQEVVVDPVYYCIDEYANRIANKYEMWNEAIVYLSACIDNRQVWTKKLLGDPPLANNDLSLLTQVLKTVIQENMPSAEKFIRRGLGQRYEHSNDIEMATIEYGKARDVKSLDRLAHQELHQYLHSGELKHVVTDMPELEHNPHYAVLILYQRFKSHLENKDFKEASAVFLQLFKSEHLPTQFETVLLIDSQVILKEKTQYYNQEQLMELINVFKRVTEDKSNQTFLSKYYQLTTHKHLAPSIITAKLRERIAYKAATADQ